MVKTTKRQTAVQVTNEANFDLEDALMRIDGTTRKKKETIHKQLVSIANKRNMTFGDLVLEMLNDSIGRYNK